LLNSLSTDDEVVFFSQLWKNNQLRLEPTNIRVRGVDTAMILVRADVIKQHHWVESEYIADGLLAEELVTSHKSRSIFKPYCFYNYLN